MSEKGKLGKTMRIDLIPDTPSEPAAGKQKRVVFATPTRRHRRIVPPRPAVTEKDARFQELLQNVYDAALVADLHGRIVDVNVRAIEFLLYERDELCALTVFDVISGCDETLFETLWENLQNERFTLIEAYCIRKDGTFFSSEVSVNKLRLGKMHLCFFIRDTTIRRQREEMLKTTYTAIQNSGNGIAVADMETKLEYVNPSLVQMWGYNDSDELLGQDIRCLFSDKDAADKMIQTVVEDQQVWTHEMRASRNSEGEFDVQVSAAYNRNSEGEPLGIVFSFVDISDRKHAEEAMRDAERQRVMLESLGAACHHLGQPATVVLANLGIIQNRIDLSDKTLNELVQASIQAAETLGKILHKLNAVNEYRTTPYLERPTESDSAESRILEI